MHSELALPNACYLQNLHQALRFAQWLHFGVCLCSSLQQKAQTEIVCVMVLTYTANTCYRKYVFEQKKDSEYIFLGFIFS